MFKVKNHIQITTLVLLGIYAMVLTHNIIPHVHLDQHDLSETTTNDHAHNHDTHHHHGEESSANWLDVLLGLLGDFSHQDIGPDHFENYVAQDGLKISLNQSTELLAITCVLFKLNEPDGNPRFSGIDPPPLLYDSLFSSSEPLRGPPAVA